jgi:hypothetical protein
MDKLTPFNCSIGIVTYLGRFETYFKPLIKKLHSLFPDFDIIVFINGHYDTVRQIKYLQDITWFLRNYPNIRYITNLEHQALARGLNWLILMSKSGKVLILNDDVSFKLEFRHNLMNLRGVPEIFTLNGSWSHFVVSKEIIRQVGWFEERLLGIGFEDADYICRLSMEGIPLGDIAIQGLLNFVAPQPDAGWHNLSEVMLGKYARLNQEVFLQKWWHSAHGPVPGKGSFKVRYHDLEWTSALKEDLEEMPEYYPMDILDNFKKPWSLKVFIKGIFAQIVSLIDALFRTSKRTLSSWVRAIIQQAQGNLRNKSN